jgi:transcriptional regulator with XRE-family HTH domain
MEETFGRRLQRLRQRAGLSQPQLASRADVPVGTIRGWEQGRRVPNLDAAVRLARAIGCSLDELAGLTVAAVASSTAPAPTPAAPEAEPPTEGKPKKPRKQRDE